MVGQEADRLRAGDAVEIVEGPFAGIRGVAASECRDVGLGDLTISVWLDAAELDLRWAEFISASGLDSATPTGKWRRDAAGLAEVTFFASRVAAVDVDS